VAGEEFIAKSFIMDTLMKFEGHVVYERYEKCIQDFYWKT
jgi:hypothetical protein